MTSGLGYRRFGKRAIDVGCSGIALVALSPVLALIALLTLLSQGRPVLFRQVRAGADARPFTVWKFRTLRAADPSESDNDRLTRLGKALRHSSLDELPQLYNVLVGDMSLVGPRPLYLHYIPLYSSRQAERLKVRPGLTGLAQVSGRNQLDWEERLRLDARYVHTYDARLDAAIILRTIVQLLRRSGTTAGSAETPREFVGSPNVRTDYPQD